MNTIVFGGSGFVGSHVADALSAAGHQVKIFDLRASAYLRPGQEMVVGNILEADQVSAAVQGCDIVYNLAGIADLDDSSTRPLDTVRQNILGNTIILEAAVQSQVQRFVYASTVYVYSDKGGFYKCSKQAAETFVEEYQKRYGLEYTILRYGTLYGPRSNKKNSIFRYLYNALTKGVIEVSGTGDERREYIHVKDAAELSLQILEERYANQRVTLTGHQSLYYRDLLAMIKEIMNNQVDIRFSQENKNGAHYNITPYSYIPKPGYKLTSNKYTDLGEGLVNLLVEVSRLIEGENDRSKN